MTERIGLRSQVADRVIGVLRRVAQRVGHRLAQPICAVAVGSHIAQRILRREQVAAAIVGIDGHAAAWVGGRRRLAIAAAVIGIGGDIPQRIGLAEQVILPVVGVAGGMTERVGFAEQVIDAVVGVVVSWPRTSIWVMALPRASYS